MLKIKDNIDLKELEKFGFDEYIGWYENIKYDAAFSVYKNTRIIKFDCSDWGLERDNGAEIIQVLFDLIQAGLVEKVNENETKQ